MSPEEQCLHALAEKQFGHLAPAEEILLASVVTGKEAPCGGPTAGKNDLHTAIWNESQTVQAKLIRWLCVDRKATCYIDPKGIHVTGAQIDGELDLQAVTIPFPLRLEDCAIHGPVLLNFAETRLLSFTGSASGPISGDKLVVHGSFRLLLGFHAKGEVKLVGATITGDLDCFGGKFLNPGNIALNVDQARIDGSVSLSQEFRAEGAVTLIEARIAGSLHCSKGIFCSPNPDYIVLDAGRAHIGGSVTLGEGFQAEGGVRLPGIYIGGDLDCGGGKFLKSGGIALNVDQARIDGNVFLSGASRESRAEGVVTLIEARIAGSLHCSKGIFCSPNPDYIVLDAGRAHIGGSVTLGEGFQAEGIVRLPGIHIGGDLDLKNLRSERMHLQLGGARTGRLLDDLDSWKKLKDFELDGFVYTTLTGEWIDAKTRLYLLRIWQRTRPFLPQPYYQLAKVLRELGQEHDVKKVLIAKERARRILFDPVQRQHMGLPHWCWNRFRGWIRAWFPALATRGTQHDRVSPIPPASSGSEAYPVGGLMIEARTGGDPTRGEMMGLLRWCWNWFLDKTMAHGYQPQRLLLIAFVFILLGSGLFTLGDRSHLMVPTKAEAYTPYEKTSKVPPFYPTFRPWLYSLDTFLPIINFGQKDYWKPRDTAPMATDEKAKSFEWAGEMGQKALRKVSAWVGSTGFLHGYRIFHIACGWVLITLGIAGVTGLVRKE